MLRPWIKILHDDYLCLVESGKQQITEVRRKFKRKTWKQRKLLSESGFVLRITPPLLSRDRRIKMKKSIKPLIQSGQQPGVQKRWTPVSELFAIDSECDAQANDDHF